MKYKVVKSFRGSPDGCRVLDYANGTELTENTDFPRELISVALVEGWVEELKPVKKKAVRRKR